MVVECPQCQAKYRLDETQLAGRTEVTIRCTKCGSRFAERLPALPGTPAGTDPSQTPLVPELPADKNVALAVTQGPLKGKVFPISQPRVVLGRAGADIVVADGEISRQHCALEVYGRRARLLDLGSTNGTWVDGERVETRELEHLSEFRIGGTVFILTVTNKD